MGNRYRRTISPQSAAGSPADSVDSTDPYAAYLSWVAQGRPSMTGGGAVRPESGTVLLSEHVQVQELSSALPEPEKSSPWRRLVSAFRR